MRYGLKKNDLVSSFIVTCIQNAPREAKGGFILSIDFHPKILRFYLKLKAEENCPNRHILSSNESLNTSEMFVLVTVDHIQSKKFRIL